MKETSAELRRQIGELRERVTRLSDAVLRVSSSLDLETVLQEVVDSARALTGARYGVIVTVDSASRAEDFVMSGLAPAETERLITWPDGPRLFAHFRDLAGPLRVPDLPAYVQALGFSTDVMLTRAVQAAPMIHRGVLVGNFFLGEKRDGLEFTSDDEEVLMLFAAQAATAIAHARTHRDERGPIWRRCSRPRRSAWSSSTVGRASSCPSIGRRGGSSRGWACPANPPMTCWE
ncbi:MAG: GAF domain-containing protein [Gemmatimonadota bacterium]|nr:GAF domain-containing protein [Gemmatimonadota bacterium]MDE2864166.1 GAF domain-containing protein [Gemmatimonadota bacterium]